MDRDQAIALLRASQLADWLERILPHLAFGMRIRTTRAPEGSRRLVSRFAGYGVLPRGVPWPVWDSTPLHRRWVDRCVAATTNKKGSPSFWDTQIVRYEAMIRDNPKPLHFLAMIRLSDVAPYAAELGLPDQGALLFFYDAERCQGSFWPEARGGWQILYVADEQDIVTVDAPPVRMETFMHSTLMFEVQHSLPEDIREETGDDDLRVYGNAEYSRVHEELLGGALGHKVIHQLGGAPQEVQSGLFIQCQLASNGIDCGSPDDYKHAGVRELSPGARDWRLVLQIDSDDEGPGWMWGDSGSLYFCMHRDDLVQARFDRAWCVEQSC